MSVGYTLGKCAIINLSVDMEDVITVHPGLVE